MPDDDGPAELERARRRSLGDGGLWHGQNERYQAVPFALRFLRTLAAYGRRETLGLDEQPELARLQIADGVVRMPTWPGVGCVPTSANRARNGPGD